MATLFSRARTEYVDTVKSEWASFLKFHQITNLSFVHDHILPQTYREKPNASPAQYKAPKDADKGSWFSFPGPGGFAKTYGGKVAEFLHAVTLASFTNVSKDLHIKKLQSAEDMAATLAGKKDELDAERTKKGIKVLEQLENYGMGHFQAKKLFNFLLFPSFLIQTLPTSQYYWKNNVEHELNPIKAGANAVAYYASKTIKALWYPASLVLGASAFVLNATIGQVILNPLQTGIKAIALPIVHEIQERRKAAEEAAKVTEEAAKKKASQWVRAEVSPEARLARPRAEQEATPQDMKQESAKPSSVNKSQWVKADVSSEAALARALAEQEIISQNTKPKKHKSMKPSHDIKADRSLEERLSKYTNSKPTYREKAEDPKQRHAIKKAKTRSHYKEAKDFKDNYTRMATSQKTGMTRKEAHQELRSNLYKAIRAEIHAEFDELAKHAEANLAKAARTSKQETVRSSPRPTK